LLTVGKADLEDDMNETKLKVVHYVNQFFGQIGSEDKADVGFEVKPGPVGPGLALQKALGDKAEIVATVICGDNYFAKDPATAAQEGLKLVEPYGPDIFFAGPAFAAGRYGIACGGMCKAVGEKLGIPVITGMYQENPGVEMYRKYAYICKTGNSTRDMAASINAMTRLAFQLLSGEKGIHLVTRENIPKPSEYNYFPRLIIRNEYVGEVTAKRTIDKLLAKVRGEPFESEVEPPKFKKVAPPEPIKDLSTSEIAIVSDGGLVPKGNPDSISSRGNLRWASYEMDSFLPENFDSSDYEVAHTGYFSVDVLQDPNRLVPADALRDLIKEGKVGKLHPQFFSTSGNATVAQGCAEMGKEMGREIKRQGVNGVILTST
jgi:glycine reductase complex component B subunit gamma